MLAMGIITSIQEDKTQTLVDMSKILLPCYMLLEMKPWLSISKATSVSTLNMAL
jgi:hypothetical protein